MIREPSRPSRVGRPLVAVTFAAQLGTALAGPEESAQERVDEARASPTPVAEKGNWIVVPIPIANPTIGNGLQATLLYLHPKKAGEESAPGGTTGLVAMGTDSGARLIGGFHDNSFDNDRFRLSAFAGSGKFNLKFYGTSEGSEFADHPLHYEMSGALGQVRGSMRIPGTESWFAGLTFQFLQSKLTFKTSDVSEELPDVPTKFYNIGLGPQLTYDSRDSNYYPQQGQYFRIAWLNYSKRWGGDFAFDKVDTFYNHYLPLGPASVFALRARLQTATDDTPFFALPTLDMRGFSADRYRDDITLSLSAEWRYRFAPRWGMVAYAEAGRFASSLHGLTDGRTIGTVGSGVRWKVTAERDINIGLDFAVSSDDKALFIQIGERF